MQPNLNQNKKLHIQRHREASLRSFVMSFFISCSLYTISDDLRNFLWIEKECALAHSRAERGRLRHVSASRECASLAR